MIDITLPHGGRGMSLKQYIKQILPNEVFKWKGCNFVYRSGWIYIVYRNDMEDQVCPTPEIKTIGRLHKALRKSSYRLK